MVRIGDQPTGKSLSITLIWRCSDLGSLLSSAQPSPVLRCSVSHTDPFKLGYLIGGGLDDEPGPAPLSHSTREMSDWALVSPSVSMNGPDGKQPYPERFRDVPASLQNLWGRRASRLRHSILVPPPPTTARMPTRQSLVSLVKETLRCHHPQLQSTVVLDCQVECDCRCMLSTGGLRARCRRLFDKQKCPETRNSQLLQVLCCAGNSCVHIDGGL
jgi:hypothetical protein